MYIHASPRIYATVLCVINAVYYIILAYRPALLIGFNCALYMLLRAFKYCMIIRNRHTYLGFVCAKRKLNIVVN